MLTCQYFARPATYIGCDVLISSTLRKQQEYFFSERYLRFIFIRAHIGFDWVIFHSINILARPKIDRPVHVLINFTLFMEEQIKFILRCLVCTQRCA